MTPALIEEIRSQVAKLKPEAKSLWDEMKRLEDELDRHKLPYESARDKWCAVYTRHENLMKMLPPEIQAELNKPNQPAPLPF